MAGKHLKYLGRIANFVMSTDYTVMQTDHSVIITFDHNLRILHSIDCDENLSHCDRNLAQTKKPVVLRSKPTKWCITFFLSVPDAHTSCG